MADQSPVTGNPVGSPDTTPTRVQKILDKLTQLKPTTPPSPPTSSPATPLPIVYSGGPFSPAAIYIILSSNAPVAIVGGGYGTDRFQDQPFGVSGMTDVGVGVIGSTLNGTGIGVMGVNDGGGLGVWGQSSGGTAVYGTSTSGVGVNGTSSTNWGIGGTSDSGAGVVGQSTSNNGVAGTSTSGDGVVGKSTSGVGVLGTSSTNWGTGGTSDSGAGVLGQSTSNNGVAGYSTSGNGVAGFSTSGNAGYFQGNVDITGNLSVTTVNVSGDVVLANADCAEEFDVLTDVEPEPGTVMVIGDHGSLSPSSRPYDRRVAGVVSGAGAYKPALLLDRRSSSHPRSPVALVGKVYCKVDAQYGPIEVGDLLTTSSTPGHAMKAGGPTEAFGAVLGKALGTLRAGQGLVPILVALQ